MVPEGGLDLAQASAIIAGRRAALLSTVGDLFERPPVLKEASLVPRAELLEGGVGVEMVGVFGGTRAEDEQCGAERELGQPDGFVVSDEQPCLPRDVDWVAHCHS